VQRVSHYTRDLARTLGQDAAFCDHIFYASPMHDVGKIAIPDHVLLKPGALLPDEWAIMKSHSDFGARILESGDSPYLDMARAIALGHHERWDGSGYPGGLKGEAIPLPARIMAVCDVYDALRSRRPYKPAFSHERALAIITEGDDRTQPGHFDPAALGAFADRAGEMSRIYAEIQD
jgi:putative two-component system response regulator